MEPSNLLPPQEPAFSSRRKELEQEIRGLFAKNTAGNQVDALDEKIRSIASKLHQKLDSVALTTKKLEEVTHEIREFNKEVNVFTQRHADLFRDTSPTTRDLYTDKMITWSNQAEQVRRIVTLGGKIENRQLHLLEKHGKYKFSTDEALELFTKTTDLKNEIKVFLENTILTSKTADMAFASRESTIRSFFRKTAEIKKEIDQKKYSSSRLTKELQVRLKAIDLKEAALLKDKAPQKEINKIKSEVTSLRDEIKANAIKKIALQEQLKATAFDLICLREKSEVIRKSLSRFATIIRLFQGSKRQELKSLERQTKVIENHSSTLNNEIQAIDSQLSKEKEKIEKQTSLLKELKDQLIPVPAHALQVTYSPMKDMGALFPKLTPQQKKNEVEIRAALPEGIEALTTAPSAEDKQILQNEIESRQKEDGITLQKEEWHKEIKRLNNLTSWASEYFKQARSEIDQPKD